MILPAQWRAARGLLNLSQGEVAQLIGVRVIHVIRLEGGNAVVPEQVRQQAQVVLENAGVEFIAENGGGAGVRLRKPTLRAIPIEDMNASNDE